MSGWVAERRCMYSKKTHQKPRRDKKGCIACHSWEFTVRLTLAAKILCDYECLGKRDSMLVAGKGTDTSMFKVEYFTDSAIS